VARDQAGDGTPTERLDAVPSGPPPGLDPRADEGARPAPRRRGWIIGVSISVLAIAGIGLAFFIGAALRAEPAAGPVAATSTPSPTTVAPVTPTPTSAPPAGEAGPAAPGLHPWIELSGGECIDPYTSPWALEFTVVDCAQPHSAQFTFRGAFPEAAGAVYPGDGAITSQLNLLCSAPTALDLAAAGQYPDLQTQAVYPVGPAQWDAGDRAYSCFVSRSSGELLTGTLSPVR
jgi:hypothetical protein